LGEVLIATGHGAQGVAEMDAGWTILTETTGQHTRRSREIAAIVAAYYEDKSETGLGVAWRQRAGDTN